MEKIITLDHFLAEAVQPINGPEIDSMDNNPFSKTRPLNKTNDINYDELGKKYKKLPYSKDKYKAMQKLRAVAQVLISIGGVGGAFRTIIGVLQKLDDLDLTVAQNLGNYGQGKDDINNSDAFKPAHNSATYQGTGELLNELSNKTENDLLKLIDQTIRKNNFEKIYTLAAKINNDPIINQKLKELKKITNEAKSALKMKEIKNYINKNYTLEEQRELVKFINELQKDLRK